MKKQCTICKDWKDHSEFNKSQKTDDGFSYYCRPCAISKQREWHKSNPGKARSYAKKFRDKNPERAKQLRKEYEAKDPERIKEIRRASYRRNKEKMQQKYTEKKERIRLMEEKLAELGIKI